jgi:hypothetical protein
MASQGVNQAARFSWERAARETLTVYDRLSPVPLGKIS